MSNIPTTVNILKQNDKRISRILFAKRVRLNIKSLAHANFYKVVFNAI